jgi:mannose-1-phosphate guanylyltransferase
VQAVILVGGEGTRLRPLTSTVPKPVVPLVDRPLVAFMLEWLRRHGVDDVVMSCGFLATSVRNVLGDGSTLGLRLRYVEEPEPRGTAGALKFAESLLEERFLMLNGDILTDIDVGALVAQHVETGARATLALVPVDDPRAYGLVEIRDDNSVAEFVEKPSADRVSTNLISAGAYMLEREILELVEPGRNVSIERDVWPALVGKGLYGYPSRSYWLDIGTPERYLQGTYDILEGNVRTSIGIRLGEAGLVLVDGAAVRGRVVAPAVVGAGSTIAEHAIVGGRAVLGRNVQIDEGAHVESSVLLDGVRVGARTTIRGSIVAAGAEIGEHCHIDGGVVLGEGVRLGRDNVLAAGARIFPGVKLPDGAIRF